VVDGLVGHGADRSRPPAPVDSAAPAGSAVSISPGPASPAPPGGERARKDTPPTALPAGGEPGSAIKPSAGAGIGLADPPTADASRTIQSFHLLGGVADKALAMGKSEEAERLLQALLNDVMARTRDGQATDAGVAEPAARYAARLAGATGKASWVEYAFEMYRRQRRVLPAPVIDELYSAVRKVKGLELAGVRAYLDALREVSSSFGPAERFLFQRIEGLERQIALK